MDNSRARHCLSELSGAAFAAVCADNPVILVPLGSHEDHGPLLPMGDYVLADVLAGRIAAAATAGGAQCYVAPTLPFGVADYFGSGPGGMAISAASFRAVLTDVVAALTRHGLTRIIILNGHGGNVPVIHEVTLGLRQRENIIVPSLYLWKIARALMARRLGADAENRFDHGAEPLLSISAALRPGMEAAAELQNPAAGRLLGLAVSDFGTLDFEGIGIDAPVEFDQVPRHAIDRAAPLASAALGDEVAAELVALASRFVVHFAHNAASDSGVSKSSNTVSVATATSDTSSAN